MEKADLQQIEKLFEKNNRLIFKHLDSKFEQIEV